MLNNIMIHAHLTKPVISVRFTIKKCNNRLFLQITVIFASSRFLISIIYYWISRLLFFSEENDTQIRNFLRLLYIAQTCCNGNPITKIECQMMITDGFLVPQRSANKQKSNTIGGYQAIRACMWSGIHIILQSFSAPYHHCYSIENNI